MRTSRVPRATRRPRGLDEVLPSSSVILISLLILLWQLKCVGREMVRELNRVEGKGDWDGGKSYRV